MFRRFRSANRYAIVAVVAAALLPLSPLAVTDAQAAPAKAADASKLAPLGAGKTKPVTPEVQTGDFKNAPPKDGLADLVAEQNVKGDHFIVGESKVVDHTANADIYNNVDGTQSADVYNNDVNFKDAKGVWQKIDNNFVPNKGKLQNAAGPASFQLNSTPTPTNVGSVNVNGKTVSFGLDRLALGKTGETRGNSVTFPAAIDGADLKYEVIGSRLKESIVLNAAPTGALSYHVPLTLNGLHAVTKADGTIALQDDKNSDVITVDPAVIFDSLLPYSTRINVAMKLAADGNSIDITPDATWLADKSRVYPVTIDPTFNTTAASGPSHYDTFSDSGNPGVPYNNWLSYGAYQDLAGYYPDMAHQHYTYMFQDLTSLTGKQIVDARLRMVVNGNSSTTPLYLHPASQGWGDSTLTWSNQANHLADTITQSPISGGATNLDITSWVSNWTNGTWGNYGIQMDTGGVNALYPITAVENSTNAPYVHVTYNSSPTTGALTGPDDNSVLMTTTPTLTATAGTDPGLKYWFRVASGASPEQGQTINSGWLSSPTWTIPTGSLINGVTYKWYLIVWDGGSDSAYWLSPVRTMKVDLRLGQQKASPMDTEGPVSVNLANGNVFTSTASPSVKTVGGDMGLSYSYNSQAQSTMGLTGHYYDGCVGGVKPAQPYIVRTDPNLDFNWGTGSPGGSIQNDNWCGTWTGFISAPAPSTYCFTATSDDGMRVWINGTMIIDHWSDGGAEVTSPPNCIALYPTTLSIKVDYYEHSGGAALQLQVTGPTVPQQTVPPTWFSTTPSAMPAGWQLSAGVSQSQSYSKAVITDAGVVLVDLAGETYEYRKAVNGTVTSFTPPQDERTTLSLIMNGAVPNYVAQSDDGLTYTFNELGALTKIISNTDDLHPAAVVYDYAAGADTARLAYLTDPVSGHKIGLKYSTGLYGGSPCNPAPAGFSAQGPPGMLCEVDYPDSTKTEIYYSGAAADAEVMRIVDPGSETTDFSYAGNGYMNGVSDPTQMDWRALPANAGGQGAYTTVNYDLSNRASSVVLASPNGTDSTATPPTTNRPWHSYTYTTPFSSSSGGETRVNVSGMSPPQGFANSATFNKYAQTMVTKDTAGLTTSNVWDAASPLSDRLLSTKNDATGMMSTTIYDTLRNLPTDSYGPAPSTCFTGQSPNGSCATFAVPHSSTQYDEGLNGLAIAWWNAASFAGAPTAHSTKIRGSDNDGRIDEAWSGTGPYILPGQTQNFSVRATGEWYARNTGTYLLNFWSDTGVNVFIDDVPVIAGGASNPTSTSYTTTQGWHRIRIDYTHGATTGGQLKFYATPPGSGTSYVVSSVDLRPDYNLATTQTTDDITSGSPAHVTKTDYGSVGGTVDAAYGLALSTTEDPGTGHLALVTGSSYEAPRGTGTYMRQLSKTLPAGNSTVYAYYGDTQTGTNPCTGATNVNQGGLMSTKSSPIPATGTQIVEHYFYDGMGRVVANWINSESPTCTTYDARGRVTSVAYPANGSAGARTVTNNYAVSTDPLTTSVADAAGTITTVSDLLGRVKSTTDVWGRTTINTYDLASRVTDTSAPGDVRHTDYDSVGRVSGQKAGNDVPSLVTVATPTYNAANEMTTASYPTGTGNGGNGTTVTIGRDTNHRTNALTYANSGGTITSDAVTYSQSGRIVDQSIDGTDPYSAGYNFTYDGAGRLTAARVPSHSYVYNFASSGGCGADTSAGKNTNRTSTTDNGGTATTYCYDNADRLTSTSDARYSSPVYDAHGNTTTLGTSTMTYDQADRHLTTVDGSNTVTYIRDALDRVVSRTAGGVVTHYSFGDSSDSPSAILDSTNTTILDKEIGLLGGAVEDVRNVSGTITATWNYSNIHGDVVASANSSGTKVGSTLNYDPFGTPLSTQIDDATANLDYGWLGSKMRGTEHEGSLNTIEMGARQYVPGLGRFIQVDPVDGGSFNTYDYAFQDPINSLDLDGNRPWWKSPWKVVAVVVVVVAAVVLLPVEVPAFAGAGAVTAGVAAGAGAAQAAVELGTIVAGVSWAAGRGGAGKNDAHGDAGRAKSAAEAKIGEYQQRLKQPGLSSREKTQIQNKIKQVRRDAEAKSKGETHGRRGK